MWAFIFAASAQAQEADTTAPPADASGEEILTEEEISSEEAFSEEALQDFNVTIEDMKANRATIMPDSPFHVFKRFGRAVTETFTFNPVAKAELRMEHANDMLAETMQMIDEDGMQRVNHSAVITAIEHYEGKLGQVAGQIEDVKAEKETQTEAVDAFLDNFIDKQLKQQKVLDSIAEDVIDVKESGVEVELAMEQIMATVEDVKGQTMTSFTNVLSGVEDTPEDMATRLSTVMDNQEGSDFKHLKNLEVLGAVYDKVPATAKEAINQAKENTKKKLEVRINTLPPAVRADKFQKYVENATVDETRLITLLDELKQSTGIPADILAKLEEAKEIAVRKFEKRLDYIDDFAIEQRYFDRFDSTQVDGLIAMEEFKNRMSKDSKSGQRMAQAHDESVGVFKKMFTDVDSQYQAEKFQMLTEEMMRNPSPKTFKLLQQLEEEVMADPQKKAFLAQTEVAMKNQFETRFRREGDMFMDRISSLDPNDIGILEGFDFGNDFNGRFVEKNTEQFQNYMQGMDDPRNFDMFRDRFSNTSEFVINEIKTKDAGFQDSMMFKMRKMEEVRFEKERQIQTASIDYQERELNFQMDRVQMQKEDEFWQKLNALPPDAYDARKQLWEQKINDQYTLVEQRFNEQKKLFDARLANDPFCDAVCKQIQLQFMDQQQRQEKTRMSDDLVRERNRIEAQKVQQQNNNPLAGKCNTPEQCDSYCQAHAGEQGCEWVMMQTNMPQACPAASFWDFNKKQCVYPQDMSAQDMQNQGMRPDDMYQPVDMARYEFHSCAQGEFWDDMRQSCMFDPYFRAPTKFQNCGFGQHWNDMRGFCEQDKVQCMTFVQVRDCNPG
ncbi:hypothetical protein KKF64_02895, partial [Patescibacteria group bacterium]|nr:hypothetical protein [Patescibacteria group bacterium]